MLKESIALIEKEHIDVYSFGITYDVYNRWMVACIDTEENSLLAISQHRAFARKHFNDLIQPGNQLGYDMLVHWGAATGRNTSLGDYRYHRVAEHQYPDDFSYDKAFIMDAIRLVISYQDRITTYSHDQDDVVFSCGTAEDEYGISWYRVRS